MLLARGVQAAEFIDSADHKETNFDNRLIAPFSEDQGFPQSDLAGEGISFQNDGFGGRRIKFHWREAEYDGTRRERGHEMKLGVVSDYEIFSGFIFYVPPTSGRVTFPANKNTIVWQLYNWNSAGCSNWTAHLEIRDNRLVLNYRPACVAANEVVVLDDVPRNQNMEIKIRARAGRGTGKFDIYVDNVRVLRLRNIDLGFGAFDSSGRMSTSVIGVKMGMYCADTANYTPNESRSLYYDNVGVAKDKGFLAGLNAIDPAY